MILIVFLNYPGTSQLSAPDFSRTPTGSTSCALSKGQWAVAMPRSGRGKSATRRYRDVFPGPVSTSHTHGYPPNLVRAL